MNVIPPVKLIASDIASTNVPLSNYPAWSAGVSYVKGDMVYVNSTLKEYEAQTPGSNHNPVTDNGTYWLETGSVNRWRAFNSSVNQKTANANTIVYTIGVSKLTQGVSFFNLEAASVRVRVLDNANPRQAVYSKTLGLVSSEAIIDYTSYFNEPISFKSEALFIGLPAFVGYQLEITIDAGAGTARVGQISIGRVHNLGVTGDGTGLGLLDFSTKERDIYGNLIIVERGFVQKVDYTFRMTSTDAKRILNVLSSVRATPAVYFADIDMEGYATTIYGIFRDFSPILSAGGTTIATLSVEGLL